MNNREESIMLLILKAMKITVKDLVKDFENSISKSNRNGIDKNVWARRSDSLVESFASFKGVEVIHIERSKLWQFDPVFDKTTGTLYVQFTDKNLKRIKNKLKREGDITHYIYSLLVEVKKEARDGDVQTFSLFDDSAEENIKNRRLKDFYNLLGKNGELIKDVKITSATYMFEELVDAKLIEYTNKFEVHSEYPLESLLHKSISNKELDIILKDSNLAPTQKQPNDTEKSIVNLKSKYKNDDNTEKK